jgi:hypothetical protein
VFHRLRAGVSLGSGLVVAVARTLVGREFALATERAMGWATVIAIAASMALIVVFP